MLSSVAPGLPPLRLRHSAGVARRAAAASAVLLPPNDADVVRAAAWLHDIGYSHDVVDSGCHAIDGARHLRQLGSLDGLVSLVAYHSGAEFEATERGLREELRELRRPPEELLDVLTFADMTADEKGHQTTVEHRLEGILDRYAADDPVHVSVEGAKARLVAAVRRVQRELTAKVGGRHGVVSGGA